MRIRAFPLLMSNIKQGIVPCHPPCFNSSVTRWTRFIISTCPSGGTFLVVFGHIVNHIIYIFYTAFGGHRSNAPAQPESRFFWIAVWVLGLSVGSVKNGRTTLNTFYKLHTNSLPYLSISVFVLQCNCSPFARPRRPVPIAPPSALRLFAHILYHPSTTPQGCPSPWYTGPPQWHAGTMRPHLMHFAVRQVHGNE